MILDALLCNLTGKQNKEQKKAAERERERESQL